MDKIYKVGSLIYDADIYDSMNTSLADLSFYEQWLPENKTARILELCCGTGRLTIPIAQKGYTITGVDNAPSMLKQARVKAEKAGTKIEFIEADIRTIDLPHTYDLIFIPFNSLHHLYKNEDLFMALQKVKKHLTPNGLFLLDCYNPNIQYIVAGETEKKQITQYITKDGRNVTIKQAMHYETKSQINRIEWHYFINGTFHSIQHLDMRMFYPQELDAYLQWNGFHVIHKFGGFDQQAFHDRSEKQIFICQLP